MRHVDESLGDDVADTAFGLPGPVYCVQRRSRVPRAADSHQRRPIDYVQFPVSSSMVANITPFAVPGRWRTVTGPHARASHPFR